MNGWQPRREHIMIVTPPPAAPSERGQYVAVKLAMAEVRGIEARRRADQIAEDVAALTDRLDALEHPAVPESEPEPVVHLSTSDRPTVGGEDADWIIGGWRDHGWQ